MHRDLNCVWMCQLEKELHHLSPFTTATSNRGIVGKEEYLVPSSNEANTWRPGWVFLDASMRYASRISFFSALNAFCFFSLWVQSIKREWCVGSHVILSEHNCRCLSLAVFLFFERGVGFPGDGEWPHHFTFLHICLPSAFSLPPTLSLALSAFSGWIR